MLAVHGVHVDPVHGVHVGHESLQEKRKKKKKKEKIKNKKNKSWHQKSPRRSLVFMHSIEPGHLSVTALQYTWVSLA